MQWEMYTVGNVYRTPDIFSNIKQFNENEMKLFITGSAQARPSIRPPIQMSKNLANAKFKKNTPTLLGFQFLWCEKEKDYYQ